jgi:hypothetical protein
VACTFPFKRPKNLGIGKGTWRACTDLAIDHDGSLLVTAAFDPGNEGPFGSVVYRVSFGGAQMTTQTLPTVNEITRIDGLKVEAIAHSGTTGQMWIGSDDEAFGGTVRPLAIQR